jgi:DNA-binding transcriptional LysR family regulator
MKRRSPSRLTFVAPAVACLAISLVLSLHLVRQMREDLYWTPVADAPALAEARPRAEVLVNGELLQDLVDNGRIAVDGRQLSATATTIRFNNVDAVTRAQMIILAAATGAGVAFLAAAMLLPARDRHRAGGIAREVS